MAIYSGIPVYELSSNGVAVMRRKGDSYVNATHILKVAGIEKGRRTKILEREIHSGEHEKIQGGYGKYQGTWIPIYRARELAEEYNLTDALGPLLDIPT
ncbi:transcription regulator HTH, apses-type DNA-binding domain-containing protein [Blyttiomyces helicus]|uniref:Transcription regulator HTH, apses-type DNA-binding domain-containing protein n=1 Tax=Blyttiomyces helicus TaxID=388810 RepID=A0A4P9WCX4_9FUNG|nr:transcription regulator HTH, apses-type DNA-binding domain-containing protein [Blyttiomyces helicus]|eukprot:RKO90364.1 transcription regulator HTH, apses-type DNA-binding domain-containing protein [Blyttiomyces helicus]